MQIDPEPGQRIAIVGTTGSGKTTLAQAVAHRLQIPHIELDALYWEPHWTPAPDDEFRSRVATAISPDRWVTDGNYSKVRELVWKRADTIVFLDYPFWLVLRRLLGRTVRRSLQKEPLWSGNRESLRQSFFSSDSILLWLFRTYARNRRKYPALLQQPEYQHLAVVHLRSPQDTELWLTKL